MKNIYLISGLGADERVFKNINFKNVNPKFIKWIPYQNKESLQEYCNRLAEQILDRSDVVLLGVSFGGIIAIELSKIIKTKKIVIISSIKTDSEKPYLYSIIRKSNILNLIPPKFLNLYSFIIPILFGVTSVEDKILLKDFIKNTDGSFIKWALNHILEWENQHLPKNLIHIHGDQDKFFPIKLISDTIPISHAGHFMILNKHEEISSILENLDIL